MCVRGTKTYTKRVYVLPLILGRGEGEQPFLLFFVPNSNFYPFSKCGVKVYVYHGLFDLLPQFFESEDASLEIASALRFTLRLPEACQGGGC